MDDDDESVFDRTVAWAIEQGIETATFHVLTPYPGTALYDRMLRHYRPAEDPRSEAITTDDFELRGHGLDECMDVVAICRSPRT